MHWGPFVGKEQQLVATTQGLHREDRDRDRLLGRIVRGYLAGRAPASADDIAWWLKLPKRDVQRGVDAVRDEVAHVEVDGRPMLVLRRDLERLPVLPPPDRHTNRVWLLPAFDEYYLGYRDRWLVSSPDMDQRIVPGRNGVFRPSVVLDGRVVGTWRRTRAGLELTGLIDLPPAAQAAVETALTAPSTPVDAGDGHG